ncbi:MAG: LysR family transcriptional regulator [Azoarcus sp.]|jgi:DNA-binding transcriptional LysR family regulator|nr:LysR family transcriptional regulator [Azoarcus sp.]
MIALKDLEIFVRTVHAGSLSAAARLMDITPAAASASLKRLEADLGVRLFVRSTRRQRLSQEGEAYLQHCLQALELLDQGRRAATAGQLELSGTLQLSIPSDIGRRLLLPWLDEFLADYPRLQLRVQVSDRVADVFQQPVDIALRYGNPPDSRMVALPLAPDNRRVLCASPAYLDRCGTPETPADLVRHNCLCFMLNDQVHDRWRFSRGNEESLVNVRGNRIADDGETVRRWAAAGHGIAYKSFLDAQQDLRDGRLVALCTDWSGEPSPLNLLCASRRQIGPAVQLLRQHLQRRIDQLKPSA